MTDTNDNDRDHNPWSEYMDSEKNSSGQGTQSGGSGWIFFLLIFGVCLLMILYFGKQRGFFETASGRGDMAYAGAWALFVSAIASRAIGAGFLKRMKNALIWLVIFMLFIVGYSYRVELGAIRDRVLGNLVPDRGIGKTADSMSFQMASDGHFHIQAQLNGLPVLFLVDTGATGIVLSRSDAKRLGYDLDRVKYDGYSETANGMVRTASVKVDNLSVGGYEMDEVKTYINESSMSESLLGMSFFSRLDSYTVQDEILTINWASP